MAGQEIRISYDVVDKALGTIDEQIQIIEMQKTKISQTKIASSQGSSGPCARALKELATVDLPGALDAINALMLNTKTFLTNAKTIWQDTDAGLAK